MIAALLALSASGPRASIRPAMASLRLVLGVLLVIAVLYRFLHASDEADHRSMLRAEGCKLKASSLLSLAFQRRLSVMDKADQKVCSQFAKPSATGAYRT